MSERTRNCLPTGALILCLVVIGASPVQAQGEIMVLVVGDSATSPASVTLTAPNGDSEAALDEDGDGEIILSPSAGPGTYRLTVSVSGQSDTTQVDVAASGTIRVTYRPDLPAESRFSVATAFAEEIVVAADRLPTKLTAIPHSVTIVGGVEIEQQRAISVDLVKLLAQEVPGLGVSSSSFSNFDITMRGRKPVVLVDGVPASTPLREGGRDLRAISPSALERVDVIRGSTAAYGMGGAGGLINYITKRPGAGKSTVYLLGGAGSSLTDFSDAQRYAIEGGAHGKPGKFDYVVNAAYEPIGSFYDADGDRIPPDPQGQGGVADTKNINVLAKFGVDVGPEQRIEAGFNLFRSEQDTEFTRVAGVYGVRKSEALVGIIDPRAVNQKIKNTVGTLRYTNKAALGSELSVQALFQDYQTIFSYFPGPFFPPPRPGEQPGGQSLINSDKLGVRIDVLTPLRIGSASTLLWGFDWINDETHQPLVDGRDWTPKMRLNDYAGFAQLEVNVSRLTLRGGARYANIDLEVDSWTLLTGPRAGQRAEGGDLPYDKVVFNGGAVFHFDAVNQIFAGYSQGFSVAEIGAILRSANVESVEVFQPGAQIINNYEVGLRNRFGRARTTVAGFISTSDLGSQYNQATLQVSRAKEKVKGLEATLNLDLSERWGAGATFSWSDGDRDSDNDGTLDQPLDTTRINPAKLTAYVAFHPSRSWLLRMQGLYSGSQDRFPEITAPTFARNKQNDFFLLDLLASVDVGRGTLTLAIENALNEDYYSPSSERFGSGLNYAKAPGASATVRYRIEF